MHNPPPGTQQAPSTPAKTTSRRKPQTPGRTAPPPIYVRRTARAPQPPPLTPEQRTSAAAAAAAVAGTLHTGGTDVCLCGACKHLLVLAARRHQVPAGAIVAHLRATTRANGRVRDVAAAPVRRPLSAQVGTTASVSVAGRRVSASEGLVALALAAQAAATDRQAELRQD